MTDPLRKKAKQTAVGLLARREHSTKELHEKLVKRGYSNDEITSIIAELQQQNLQSDARYTEAYIRMRAQRGYGPIRITQELKQRGIVTNLINQALAQSDINWQALAEATRLKKFGDEWPQDFIQRSQQKKFLHYRGYAVDLE